MTTATTTEADNAIRQPITADQIIAPPVPDGKSGPWLIDRLTLSEQDAFIFSCIGFVHSAGIVNRPLKAGTITRLIRDDKCIMSDTDAERKDHLEPINQSKGHVLIFGLGLGMIVNTILEYGFAESVTVVERDHDVLSLSGVYYKEKFGDRLTIVHMDAMSDRLILPPQGVKKWGMVWCDIWDDITMVNLVDMLKLRRRYEHMAEWFGCWAEAECVKDLQFFIRHEMKFAKEAFTKDAATETA